MSTLFGLLNIGATSLQENQAELGVHGNNIANATTPGYGRRSLRVDEGQGPDFGGGVRVSGTERAEDFILSQRLAGATGALGQATVLSGSLREIEQVLQAGHSSLSDKVTALGQAFSALAAAPADPALRQDVIEKGRAVAAEFNRVAQQLAAEGQGNREQALSLVPQINDLAGQLAVLNRKALASAGDTTSLRNLDQRDHIAGQLAELTGGQVLRNSDGSLDVLAGGLSLVHGAVASPLALADGGAGLQATIGGSAPQVALSGKLGGALLSAEVAQKLLGQFDRLAFDLSSAINAQHALGVGLDGMGARLFFQKLPGPAGAALGLALDAGLTPTTLAAGFTGDAGDNRNALALSNLIDRPVLDGGRQSFRNVYGGIVAALGARVQQADGDVATATGQKEALTTAQQSASGVSTNEETARLTAFQRSFEASAKFIQIVDQMLGTLTTNGNI